MSDDHTTSISGPDRRSMLRLLALASAAAATRQTVQAAPKDKRVLVIGAGASGLAAAQDLKTGGFNVTVLEGRDRIGGRLWTDTSLGVPVDIGASWIMGSRTNPVGKLARKSGFRTVPTDWDSVDLRDFDGARVSDEDAWRYEKEFEGLMEEVERYAYKIRKDQSWMAAVNHLLKGEKLAAEDQRALDFFIVSLENGAGTDFKNLSLWGGDDKGFRGDDQLLPGGYVQIAKLLSAGLDIRTGQKVQSILYGKDGVTVKTSKGVEKADAVLVTLPLGVLQKGNVKFEPGLPKAKAEAIGRMGFGVLNKVVLKFPEVFWDDEAEFIGYASKTRGEFAEFMNYHPPSKQPILVGFTSGSFARGLEKKPESEVADMAFDVLKRIYGKGIPKPTAHLVARWASDPFAYGSYSYPRVGSPDKDRDVLRAPIGDQVYFAGEATIKEYYGTVHGAYISGQRAAAEIEKTIG